MYMGICRPLRPGMGCHRLSREVENRTRKLADTKPLYLGCWCEKSCPAVSTTGKLIGVACFADRFCVR